MTRRRWILAGSIVVVAIAVLGALVFKPWLLFIDVAVHDSLPVAVATIDPAAPAPAAAPVQLSVGELVSHEHATSGTVRVIRQLDGSLVVAVEGLKTSNGPDVHVWLSAADVVEGRAGWFTAAGAPHLDLGSLKGNLGDQLYPVPAGTALADFRSVSLWCEQFSVSFGAAQLS